MSERPGLVLGGGGITGIAWETGMVAGLAEHGIDLSVADLVVGTSAGSVVGAQLTTGTPVAELYERQLEPPSTAPPARIGPRQMLGFALALAKARGDLERFGRELGRWATRTAAAGRTPTLAERYAAIEDRLPVHTWPDRPLLTTAVDATTGVFRTFGRDDGAGLVEAVTASCAVPGVYPPVPIGGHTYIDGGVRSGANADLATGCDRVVVLAPMVRSVCCGAPPNRSPSWVSRRS